VSALGSYLEDELHRRDLSPEDFGRRSGLGTSHVYQIIRGQKTNVRQSTIDRIAEGLGMTPAELMVAIGKGAADDSPKRASLHALLRLVPDEDLSTIERVVRPFVVLPAQPRPSARHDARSSRLKAKQRELEQAQDGPSFGAEDSEAPCYSRAGRLLLAAPRPLVAPIGA